jgi:hypothetical protein
MTRKSQGHQASGSNGLSAPTSPPRLSTIYLALLEGAAPPSCVGLTEWDTIEQAAAFYKSKAWTDLALQRDKAVQTIRRYVVEAMN